MLAGVMSCIRILTVGAILTPAEQDCQGENDDRKLLKTPGHYLADGGYSPMSKKISLLAYGELISRDHGK